MITDYTFKDIKFSLEEKTKHSIKRKGSKSEINLDSLITVLTLSELITYFLSWMVFYCLNRNKVIS